jgi:hypothetical protein
MAGGGGVTLKDQIDAAVLSASSDLGEIREQLTALEHSMPAVCGRTLNIRQIMMTLATRLNGIKVIVAKEIMMGHEEQATRRDRAEDMELFAGQARSERPPALLLASLHRACDHTLDDEEGES